MRADTCSHESRARGNGLSRFFLWTCRHGCIPRECEVRGYRGRHRLRPCLCVCAPWSCRVGARSARQRTCLLPFSLSSSLPCHPLWCCRRLHLSAPCACARASGRRLSAGVCHSVCGVDGLPLPPPYPLPPHPYNDGPQKGEMSISRIGRSRRLRTCTGGDGKHEGAHASVRRILSILSSVCRWQAFANRRRTGKQPTSRAGEERQRCGVKVDHLLTSRLAWRIPWFGWGALVFLEPFSIPSPSSFQVFAGSMRCPGVVMRIMLSDHSFAVCPCCACASERERAYMVRCVGCTASRRRPVPPTTTITSVGITCPTSPSLPPSGG